MSPEYGPLSDIASAIRTGKLSPVDYIQTLFRDMNHIEPRVRAWVTVDRDRVISEARNCEAEARSGRFR